MGEILPGKNSVPELKNVGKNSVPQGVWKGEKGNLAQSAEEIFGLYF